MCPIMKLTINGQEREIPDGTMVREMVIQLTKRPEVAVVERNGAIIDRSRWAETKLAAGDQVEIVAFVGGG
jgi:sulfur carrier protein